MQADLQNGVLTITLPKAETVRPRKIQVNVR
ncbi:MAG TPA: Hsp20 family protein [Thermogutta sp.]|nr:Hsp20 family protein [Thermogutta sp.]